jgi:hypothetical protein
MNQIIKALFAAKAKMPAAMTPADSASILLTLLFWKLMSDWVGGKAVRASNRYQTPSPNTAVIFIRQSSYLIFNDAALYGACRWVRPQDACLAVRESLFGWINLQANPMLHCILRPERFGKSSPNYALFSTSGLFAEVVELIGGMSFEHSHSKNPASPPLLIGEIFSRMAEILDISPQALPHEVTQLLVSILWPSPIDAIYDPACGDAQLLLACVTDMGKRVPNHQIFLLGNVASANQAALAGMQLLTHGLRLFALAGTDALSAGSDADFSVADAQIEEPPGARVVLTRIPLQAQDWDYVSAVNDPRFPLSPPKDSRIALIWHGLAHLKGERDRMGILLPLELLDSEEGLVLRRYLVQNRHLDAVIELPATRIKEPLLSLVVLRSCSRLSTVAFISSKAVVRNSKLFQNWNGQYDAAAVVATYKAYRVMARAPWINEIDQATFAAHDYQFNLSAYAE